MPCHLSCETCNGPRADQCVTCPPTWHLAAGYCRATCPNGFYQNEYGCHKCHEFCKNCIGKFETEIFLLLRIYSFLFVL